MSRDNTSWLHHHSFQSGFWYFQSTPCNMFRWRKWHHWIWTSKSSRYNTQTMPIFAQNPPGSYRFPSECICSAVEWEHALHCHRWERVSLTVLQLKYYIIKSKPSLYVEELPYRNVMHSVYLWAHVIHIRLPTFNARVDLETLSWCSCVEEQPAQRDVCSMPQQRIRAPGPTPSKISQLCH